MRHTRTLAATTAVLAVAGLAACGTKSASTATGTASAGSVQLATVADAMAQSTKATSQYTSVKVKMAEHIQAQGQDISTTGSGALSWKPIAMDMTMSMPALAAQVGGDGSIRMMMSGTTMYMNMGDVAAAKNDGKHWMKIDLTAMGASGQALADQMNNSASNDPSTQLKLFTSSPDIQRVGQETVDGVQTTHYSGTVDLTKLAAAQDPALKAALAQSTKLGLTTMNVDLWVNDQNLPIRIHESTPPTATTQLDLTGDYSDYSTTQVTVTPPPDSDTTDLSTALQGATN
ncbi:hypothetical protein [Kitasatospora viridis]|uniref:LppX_LprAFG lipoprotein n=1 Tax=Kitasatospora viridis TaxID=281105 RepID=A0A561SDR0_9ACTN|nr:hypothetical protein [Kitasatospora viridis]TWF73003.1 hypothetical protein FHX73_16154 [Kitasatospora viridis]